MPESSLTNFARDVAVFGILVVGIGIALHLTVPFFDFIELLGSTVGLLVDYPRVLLLFLILGAAFVFALFVDDKLTGAR